MKQNFTMQRCLKKSNQHGRCFNCLSVVMRHRPNTVLGRKELPWLPLACWSSREESLGQELKAESPSTDFKMLALILLWASDALLGSVPPS